MAKTKTIPVHYAKDDKGVCGAGFRYRAFVTTDPAKVTCQRCLRMLETKRQPAARVETEAK